MNAITRDMLEPRAVEPVEAAMHAHTRMLHMTGGDARAAMEAALDAAGVDALALRVADLQGQLAERDLNKTNLVDRVADLVRAS